MRIKKFEAETIPRALAKVKYNLGLDAVILSVKRKKTAREIYFPTKRSRGGNCRYGCKCARNKFKFQV